MDRVKLIIIARSQIVCDGLKSILANNPDLHVVHTFAAVGEQIQQLVKQKFYVTIVCTDLAESDSAERIAEIEELSKYTNIIALGDSGSDVECIAAIRAGARAYISKDISREDIIQVIKLVANNSIVISSTMAEALLEEFKLLGHVKGATGLGASGVLSAREEDVLSLVAQGLRNKEIANSLFISNQTVMVHVRNIMNKLHAHTREQAVAFVRAENERGAVDKTSRSFTKVLPIPRKPTRSSKLNVSLRRNATSISETASLFIACAFMSTSVSLSIL